MEMASLRAALAAQAFTEQATVERASRTPDGAGGMATTWETVGSLVCQVRRPSLRDWQKLQHAQVQGTVRVVWTAVDADLQPGDRLVWDGRRWDVVDVETRRLQKAAMVREIAN